MECTHGRELQGDVESLRLVRQRDIGNIAIAHILAAHAGQATMDCDRLQVSELMEEKRALVQAINGLKVQSGQCRCKADIPGLLDCHGAQGQDPG